MGCDERGEMKHAGGSERDERGGDQGDSANGHNATSETADKRTSARQRRSGEEESVPERKERVNRRRSSPDQSNCVS
jgi:hypothetical protein